MAAAASKAGKAKSTLIPLGDRVVVEREESEQTTSGGILLPDSAKDKPARGVVVVSVKANSMIRKPSPSAGQAW